ncbi:uncharacterized protein DC041_0005775 [Schistosoma bovis]|uniref:Reverse transcriptase RNase H-like domain-containing protein n=1 Tax=Schistosoma bovis TaxID=6184 RepID=A0A430QPH2_SCHBO|nr:uncharacterized protein DC041_0005775 [Schistosoma bovis]
MEDAAMHAFRSITPAEKCYKQLEKHELTIVFSVCHFHKLFNGRYFMLLALSGSFWLGVHSVGVLSKPTSELSDIDAEK